MMTCLKLLHLAFVAARAIIGSHDDSNLLAVVLEGCRVRGVGAMAGVAINAGLRVAAVSPLLDRRRSRGLMTGQTLLAFRRDLERLLFGRPCGDAETRQH